MRLQPPPILVALAATAALALLVLAVISQRTYATMNVPDTFGFDVKAHYVEYPLQFTMTVPPPNFRHRCNHLLANQTSANCYWVMYLGDQPVEDRIRLLLHEGAGAQDDNLFVRYGDDEVSERGGYDVTASNSGLGFWQNGRTSTLAAVAAIFVIFGLLVIWRGRDAAVWLGLFCVCLAPFFLNFYGALGPAGMVDAWTLGVVLRRVADFALFAMALVLVAPYLKPRLVTIIATVGIAISAIAVVVAIVPKFEGIYRGYVDAWLDATKGRMLGIIEILLLGALPLALLLVGIARAREPERSRLAIVAGVVAIGLIGPVIDGTINGADHFGEPWATVLLIPIGFTYAIPRYHVVDVGFVINRIVIYVLLVGTVSAAIAFAEVVITKFAEELSNPAHMVQMLTSRAFVEEFKSSLLRSVPVVFVIVLSLRWVHEKLEDFVNQVIFRKRHEALNELKDFTKRTDFAQTREGLLREAMHEISTSLGTRGVAVYERVAHGYHRSAHLGAFPAHVDDDDFAFLFMRAERTPVRLAKRNSALGESGIAFPMCLRSDLYGAVVCGPRLNEEYEGDYAPDELDVMQELVARLAEQLFALAADDRLEFINDIASGDLRGDTLLARAMQLRSENINRRVRNSVPNEIDAN